MFGHPYSHLNPYQLSAVRLKYVTFEEIKDCKRFDNQDALLALERLLNVMKLTSNEALLILSKLNSDQVLGVALGLNYEEVLDLSKEQLDFMFKYGLSRDEVKDLNNIELSAYIRLRRLGITSTQIHNPNWCISQQHIMALGFLLTVKKMTTENATALLKPLTALQASALSYGMTLDDLNGLTDANLKMLIEAKKYEHLCIKRDVVDLNEIQLETVKSLSHWGATSERVRKIEWLQSRKQLDALIELIQQQFFDFNAALAAIKDLDADKIQGVTLGLSTSEVLELNSYHIRAVELIKFYHGYIPRPLSINKPWFNSTQHVTALQSLLTNRGMNLQEAMTELDGFDSNEADLLCKGIPRKDIAGLNPEMREAIYQFKHRKLQGCHLRNKRWFNSSEHVRALAGIFKTQNHLEDETLQHLISMLESMHKEQLKLVARGLPCEKVKNLSEIQIRILVHQDRFPTINRDAIMEATFLITETQYSAFELLYKAFHQSNLNYLQILQLACSQGRISELTAILINDKLATEFDDEYDITKCRFFKKNLSFTHATANNPSSNMLLTTTFTTLKSYMAVPGNLKNVKPAPEIPQTIKDESYMPK